MFGDFDDPHTDLKKAKAVLAARIVAVLDEHLLTLRKADLGRVPLDRLIKMLAALDGSIRVTVHVASEPSGAVVSPTHSG